MIESATTRRGIMLASLAATAMAGLGRAAGADEPVPATPACLDASDETPARTEGPFYTPDTPMKQDFSGDGPGTPLLLGGFVVSTACRPLAGAVVDLWHADADGRYDNAGYRFRGHQLTDPEGRFGFATVVPGLYPGRTRHFHVKVQAPNRRILTTQLYFPGEPRNKRDFLFRPELLMSVNDTTDGKHATFNFVLNVS